MLQLIGPFTQLLPLTHLPERGAISDEALQVIEQGAILAKDGKILEVGSFASLFGQYPEAEQQLVQGPVVALPGFIDAHTHICFAGSRAMDFAARNAGKTYLEIAAAGGGIWSTVQHTRAATEAKLLKLTKKRLDQLASRGVTTVEIKSGYGLSVPEELKQLRAIQKARKEHPLDVVSTCLAAHMKPRDYAGSPEEYLQHILDDLVPVVEAEGLARRFDIFIEESAFTPAQARPYLQALKERGFDLTVHGDQFTVGGSAVAVACGARSVDHLEVSGVEEAEMLGQSNTIPVILPGATMGLGCAWGHARILLDYGSPVAIASDWNPGSAPQGNLLAQAGLLAAFEELSTAEVFAGITERAARALGLTDCGTLEPGKLADIVSFPTTDYREILYLQGSLMPNQVWKRGEPQL
ncbi:MAG: imidazolonepropionase [Bacteroidota bacterium]